MLSVPPAYAHGKMLQAYVTDILSAPYGSLSCGIID